MVTLVPDRFSNEVGVYRYMKGSSETAPPSDVCCAWLAGTLQPKRIFRFQLGLAAVSRDATLTHEEKAAKAVARRPVSEVSLFSALRMPCCCSCRYSPISGPHWQDRGGRGPGLCRGRRKRRSAHCGRGTQPLGSSQPYGRNYHGCADLHGQLLGTVQNIHGSDIQPPNRWRNSGRGRSRRVLPAALRAAGDKQNSPVQLMIFAAQHRMHWVNLGLNYGNNRSYTNEDILNRDSYTLGMAG